MTVDALLTEREVTHGDFADVARIAQELKATLRLGPNWPGAMTHVQREACDAIAAKLARVVCGDPSHPDHFDDIGGYAALPGRVMRD